METDFLIIGSGVAGLNCALKASKYGKVILATKDKLEESNTWHAQGGLAAVFGKDDSYEAHIEDTLRAGDGLSNRERVEVLVKEAPKRILELKQLGLPFDTDKNGFILSREAVHSRARIVHATDITGRELEKTLAKKVRENKKIIINEYHTAVELITRGKKCIGCIFYDLIHNTTLPIFSKKVILATGGIGRLYSRTTNPEIATGDGIALAFRAGALLEDMEFVQFHPTMLYHSSPPFLISETLRGEGGLLVNKHGKTYMRMYHRDGELAPRDVVARFSAIEMKKTNSNYVYLDMTHFESSYVIKRFPNIYKECLKYGIDITKSRIPVIPAAHYLCGGIKTNEYAMTTIQNLYAIGECACTQIHGADRLASNSMTEGLVFGSRLIEKIKKDLKKEKIIKTKITIPTIIVKKNYTIERLKEELQDLMWQNVGIIRTKKGLLKAKDEIERLQHKLEQQKEEGITKEFLELKNMLVVAKIITVAALRRKESRGTHYIEDYPERYDSIWQKHLTLDIAYDKLKQPTFHSYT